MPPFRPLILQHFPDRTPARNLLREFQTDFDQDQHTLSELDNDIERLEGIVNRRNRRRIRALKRVLQGHVEDMKHNRLLSIIVFANLSQMLEEEENGVRIDNIEFEQVFNSALHLYTTFVDQRHRVVTLINDAGGYNEVDMEEEE